MLPGCRQVHGCLGRVFGCLLCNLAGALSHSSNLSSNSHSSQYPAGRRPPWPVLQHTKLPLCF